MHPLTLKNARTFGLWVVLGIVLLWPAMLYADVVRPADAESIQSRLQAVIDYLDSPQYSRLVSWNEHVVLSYRLARGRAPTALEFYLLGMLRYDIGFSRSAVLSVALRAEAPYPGWSQCRDFVRQVAASDFRSSYRTRTSARRLARTPRLEIMKEAINKAPAESILRKYKNSSETQSIKCTDYKIYFGGYLGNYIFILRGKQIRICYRLRLS